MLNRKNSGINSVEPENRRQERRQTGETAELTVSNRKKAALTAINYKETAASTALNRRDGGVNDVEPEKKRS